MPPPPPLGCELHASCSFKNLAMGLIKPYIQYRNWTPSLAACAISLQAATSWFTQQRVRNKLYIRNYSRGVQNAQYSTSDCRTIDKTG